MLFSRIRFAQRTLSFDVISFKSKYFSSFKSNNLDELKKVYTYLDDYITYPHFIKTQDNVELKCFRIRSKSSSLNEIKKPVYMQHGLGDSADTWICNQKDKSPALILADKGYDVWIGNTRGNAYRDIKNFKNWNFSFDQMAQYDIPATLKYIHSQTNQKIHYVGHSQGTLVMFIGLSQYKDKVQQHLTSFCALGPVVYLKDLKSCPVQQLQTISKIIRPFLSIQYLQNKLNSFSSFFDIFDPKRLQFHIIFSSLTSMFGPLTSIITSVSSDKDPKVNNNNRINNVIFKHSYPSLPPLSLKNFDHFLQYYETNQFKKYDYGKKQNKKKYNSQKPPFYDLSKIDFPVHMFVGGNDLLATPKNAQLIDKHLVHAPKLENQPRLRMYNQYGHISFIWGKETPPRYLNDVLSVFDASQKVQNKE